MLIKTVSTVVTTDSTGKPVDALPVREAVDGETDAAGRPVTPINVTEDPSGIPVRLVTGKAAQNSAGRWVDTIPVKGAGVPVSPGMELPAGVLASPVALYSSKRLSTYSGPFAKLADGSDVAFSGEVPTVPGGVVKVQTLYDQSGNSQHLVQATAVNQPVLVPENVLFGRLPMSFAGSGLVQPMKMLGPGTLSVNRQNFTTYIVLAPVVSARRDAMIELCDAPGTTSSLVLFAETSKLQASGGGALSSALPIKSSPGIISYSSAPTSRRMRNFGVETLSGSGHSSNVAANLLVGVAIANAGYASRNDVLFMAVYPSAHDQATMLQMEAFLAPAFNLPSAKDSLLVYGGSSLIEGTLLSNNRLVQVAAGYGFDALPNWDCYNMGVYGRTLATEYGQRANYIALYDASKAKNVCIIDAPANEILGTSYADQAAAEAAADTIYTGTTLPFVSALKAAGFRVVVPTIITADAYASNSRNFARLRYNENARNGAAANGYVVSDRVTDVRLQNASNMTYFYTDNLHLTNAGTAVLAGIDKTAALAA